MQEGSLCTLHVSPTLLVRFSLLWLQNEVDAQVIPGVFHGPINHFSLGLDH